MPAKQCRICGIIKPTYDMVQDRRCRDGYSSRCKACLRNENAARINKDRAGHNARRREQNASDPRQQMVHMARVRAKKRGVPCTIRAEDFDIPSLCPALGVPLQRGLGKAGPNSPTLDCIVPGLGYVLGNVEVLSNLANRIKSNATPEQVLEVGIYLINSKEQRRTLLGS